MKDFSMFSTVENDSLKQFIDELKYALRKLSDEDLTNVFFDASKIAAKTTYNAKKKSILNVADFAKKTYKRYNENGFLKSAYDDGISAKEFISSLPEKVTTTYDLFIKQPREKQIEVIENLEEDIKDKDVLLQKGKEIPITAEPLHILQLHALLQTKIMCAKYKYNVVYNIRIIIL